MKLRKVTPIVAFVIGAAFMLPAVPASASFTPAPGSMDSVLRATYLVQQDWTNLGTGLITKSQFTRDLAGWYNDMNAYGAPFSNAPTNFAAFLKAQTAGTAATAIAGNTWLLGLIAQEVHYIETGNT